jgi:hypothetical protein
MKTSTLLTASLVAGTATAFTGPATTRKGVTQLHESKADLADLAGKLNPIVKYFDPLGVADTGLWGFSE